MIRINFTIQHNNNSHLFTYRYLSFLSRCFSRGGTNVDLWSLVYGSGPKILGAPSETEVCARLYSCVHYCAYVFGWFVNEISHSDRTKHNAYMYNIYRHNSLHVTFCQGNVIYFPNYIIHVDYIYNTCS